MRDDVNAKVTALRSALQGKDLPAIQRAADELSRALQAIGSSMYGSGAGPQQTPGGTPGGAPGGAPGGDQGPQQGGGSGDVVEGEFKQM